jgi:hypothetical protein
MLSDLAHGNYIVRGLDHDAGDDRHSRKLPHIDAAPATPAKSVAPPFPSSA